MTAVPTPGGGRETSPRTISARLSKRDWATVLLAIRVSGLSRSDYLRRALLQRAVPLRPFEPLLAQAIALRAQCRRIDDGETDRIRDCVERLDTIMQQLCRLSDRDPR